MTALTTSRLRLDPGARRDLTWRLALVVLAATLVMLGVSPWVRAPLSIAALLVTAEYFVVRYRRRGVLDSIAKASGAAIAAFIILGLLLDVAPFGLTAPSWGAAIGTAEVALLVVLAIRWPQVVDRRWLRRTPPVAGVVWGVLIAGVLTSALVWSVASFNATHNAPVELGMTTSGSSYVITLSSQTEGGPYRLELVNASGEEVLQSNVLVGPSEKSVSLRLPAATTGRVELVRSRDGKVLRSLILSYVSTTKETP